MKIKCTCGHKENIEKMELDDSTGFPYYGFPVCSKCRVVNKDYKYLMQLDKYIVAGDIPVERAVLVRKKSDREKLIKEGVMYEG